MTTADTTSAATRLDQRMADLAAHRVPFVRATVVRAKRPTSASPGDVALVMEDGHFEGFVGGSCAEATVRRYSLDALGSGEPLLLRISPDQIGDGDIEEGAVTVGNPCLSGGEIEIFLEPRRPAPRLIILGDTPIGRGLRMLGQDLGYDIDGVTAAADADVKGAAAVVVASHGREEEPVLADALHAGVPYVGLVASRKRAAAVLASLDVTPEQRASVHSPAGLDIGAHTAPEVALSILAEVVASVRSWEPGSASSESAEARADGITLTKREDRFRAAFAVDPVCGMTVAAVDTSPHSDVGGERHWFCCTGCQETFEAAQG
ncbi:MAG TPA: XdhC family protein [Acidimicrobiales bacterium]|jgi:xanthine dehydrogenase accessory factor|nr:XdhC family protein [Acidimicrobiales bacterium]